MSFPGGAGEPCIALLGANDARYADASLALDTPTKLMSIQTY